MDELKVTIKAAGHKVEPEDDVTPVVDLGPGPEDEIPPFETLEDAEATLGPLPLAGPEEPDEPDQD